MSVRKIVVLLKNCGISFFSGSHATLLGLINSWVHVIMYFYYFLTSFRPELKNSLWWKKHITQVQLVGTHIAQIHTQSSFRV